MIGNMVLPRKCLFGTFSHPDVDAIKKVLKLKKHYMSNGASGIAIHRMFGDRNNQYLFAARFNSMQN